MDRAGVWGRQLWHSLSGLELVFKNFLFSRIRVLCQSSNHHNLGSSAEAETKWISFYAESFEVLLGTEYEGEAPQNTTLWRAGVDFCGTQNCLFFVFENDIFENHLNMIYVE